MKNNSFNHIPVRQNLIKKVVTILTNFFTSLYLITKMINVIMIMNAKKQEKVIEITPNAKSH